MQETLAHYTTLEAMHGIIKKDGLHFRATRYDKLNDSNEYKWLYEPLKKRLAKEGKVFEEGLDNLYEKFPYVISFTEGEDDATLWERYGKNGKGVALVFDYKSIEPTPGQLCGEGAEWDVLLQINYASKSNKMNVLNDATNNYRDSGYGTANTSEEFDDEINCCAFVKEGTQWSGEKEWRYARIRERITKFIYKGSPEPDILHLEDIHGVGYYDRGKERIPYLDIKFNPQSLLKVIIGSKLNFEEESLKVRKLLNSFEDRYTDVMVEKSNVEH